MVRAVVPQWGKGAGGAEGDPPGQGEGEVEAAHQLRIFLLAGAEGM